MLCSVCIYIEVSLKLCSLFKIYIYIHTHTTSSSFVFLGLLTSSAQIVCEGVSCFSEKKEKETLAHFFFFSDLGFKPNLTLEKEFFPLFERNHLCLSRLSLVSVVMWKCSLDLDLHTRVNFLSRSVEITR